MENKLRQENVEVNREEDPENGYRNRNSQKQRSSDWSRMTPILNIVPNQIWFATEKLKLKGCKEKRFGRIIRQINNSIYIVRTNKSKYSFQDVYVNVFNVEV